MSPSQILYRNLQSLFKADRIRDMPTVKPKSLGNVVVSIAADHLRQPGVWAAKLSIPAGFDSRCILPPGIKIIRTAKIVFGSCPTDGRKPAVIIHVKFNFPFAPPAVVMSPICKIGTYILALAPDTVYQHIVFLIGNGVQSSELGVEVGRISRNVGFKVINLIIQDHVLIGYIFHGNPAFFSEGHPPVTIKSTSRINADGKGLKG